MKRLKKIITFSLAVLMVFVPTTPFASAKTLQQRNQEIRAKYRIARQQYLKEVNWYKSARQQFLTARAKYRKFKNAENKAAYEQRARAFLEKTVEVLIKRLESLKTWVSNRVSLTEADKQSIIAEIDEDINWLNEKKSGISTASGEQIKEKAKEIRNYWRRHRIKVKKIVAQIWAARLNWAISRFENASTKAGAKIEELKAAGYDTTQLEAWLADMNEKIDLAKEKYEAAKEKYQAISSLEDANSLFNQAHQFIKEANTYLRQAHQQLVKIIRQIKKLPVSTTATSSTSGE